MSQLPASPRRLAVVGALTAAAACLVAVAPLPTPVVAATEVAHRWSGYEIPATGRASGGWIGGYDVDGTPVFVTTPTRRPNRQGYSAPGEVGDLPGRTASRAETARAAWILSKYGGYREATQAAAVDASVYHLLGGRAWRVTETRGARRIRQSGAGADVARFARIMLRQSRASAGRYTAGLTATTADLGGTVEVTVEVTDGHGSAAAGLPVTLRMGGSELPASVTGDDGRAVGRFPATARGWQDVIATVRNVPDHRLHLRMPEADGQAAAAEGGARRRIVLSGRAAVRGPQTLSLAADPAQLVAGSPARVVVTVGGGDAARTAGADLHGPFASPSEVHCSGSAAGSVSAPVAGDGTYALPGVTVPGGGYFVWGVGVDGTETSVPVATCGATVRARSRTTVTLAAPATATRFGVVSAEVTVSGLPFGGPVDVTTALYGPYASAVDACSGTHRDVVQRRPGNGTFPSLSFQVDEPGWYAWRSSLPEGDLWLGATSPCAAVGTLTQVL